MRALKKVRNEIKKKEAQLAILQDDLEQLRAQEKQLEDTEMITAIRGARLSADDMLAFIHALKSGDTDISTLLATPGQADADGPGTEFKESEDNDHAETE